MRMNYISLFSSAGVGCYGFKEEGFEGVATSELIQRRLNIQRINKKVKYDNGYILGDITKKEKKTELFDAINFYKERENEEEIDVIIFTPPCQGMSVANHKKNDGTIDKNSLVVEALEIVEKIKPRFFVSENVGAYMNTKCIDHNEIKKIKDAFHDYLESSYVYVSKKINFKDYGAHSSRTRTLVIGVRRDYAEEVNPESLFPERKTPLTIKELIHDLPKLEKMGEIDSGDIYHGFKKYRSDMREWISNIGEGESAFDNPIKERRPHRIIDGIRVENVNKNGDKYKRQRWDQIAPCVHTRNDILASQNTIHPVDDRVFSIRELMIFMNVPSSFRWVAESEDYLNKMGDTEKEEFLKVNEINIRQSLGEAVPTIIMKQIAEKIKDALNGN